MPLTAHKPYRALWNWIARCRVAIQYPHHSLPEDLNQPMTENIVYLLLKFLWQRRQGSNGQRYKRRLIRPRNLKKPGVIYMQQRGSKQRIESTPVKRTTCSFMKNMKSTKPLLTQWQLICFVHNIGQALVHKVHDNVVENTQKCVLL